MPNRIIRPGINDSERVNQLDWPEEVFYRRLMSVVDDHGLYDARPAKLRADLYPLKLDRVREADISRWIAECVKAGLIVLYEADSKPYLLMLDTRWQVRSEPRFPSPPSDVLDTARSCAQLRTQTETETKAHTKSLSCTEPQAATVPEPVFPVFPCVGKSKTWKLRDEQINEWKSAYPDLDIVGECRKAHAWVKAVPRRRKTASGMPRFLFGWLGRAQDKPNLHGRPTVSARVPDHEKKATDQRIRAQREEWATMWWESINDQDKLYWYNQCVNNKQLVNWHPATDMDARIWCYFESKKRGPPGSSAA